MTTPNTDLQEQIAGTLCFEERGDDFDTITNPPVRRDYLNLAAAVLPIVDAAVKAGKAEAWREGFQEGYPLEPRPDWANAPEHNPYRQETPDEH